MDYILCYTEYSVRLDIMHITGVVLYMLNCFCVLRNLLKMFNEIHYWDRLLYEIPHYVSEVYQRREELHILRENVLLVVRDYNRSVWLTDTDFLSHIPAEKPVRTIYRSLLFLKHSYIIIIIIFLALSTNPKRFLFYFIIFYMIYSNAIYLVLIA